MSSQRLLDPLETRAILDWYGIPQPPQALAADAGAAVAAAERVGFPVALKVAAAGISHKSDVGGVRLGLADGSQVRAAFAALMAALEQHAPGVAVQGVLVQQMVHPAHEVMVGVKRDPVFGPLVVLALGGVWVELVRDMSIRPAPLGPDAARAMVSELRGGALLRGYRGAPPADLGALAALAERVGRLAVEMPELVEMDLNPVIVGPEGSGAVAVDARIVIDGARRAAGPEAPGQSRPGASGSGAGGPVAGDDPAARLQAIHRLLNPRHIAVIGASADPQKGGGRLLRYLREHGFPGPIHPVNPGEAEVQGLRCYPSVLDVPDEVDLACIIVPAPAVAQAVADAGRKGIPAAIIYTSGFTETGPAGRAREESVLAAAAGGGVRICGPNTVGVVNPSVNTTAAFSMAFEAGAEAVPAGDIAFVTQSGALGSSLLSRCWAEGIGFSRWICTGNEADLTLADYLLYLAGDPYTRVIAVFMEAVRDPHSFRLACQRAAAAGKPIVVYKTGRSQVGQRAVRSHTGALAGDDAVYAAIFREYGVIRVHDLQALLDAAVALSWQPLPAGPNLGVVSASGGACSVVADECERHGLTIPLLSHSAQARIASLIPPYGAAQNPVDVTMQINVNPQMIGQVLDAMAAEGTIDALLVMLTTNADPPATEVARGVVQVARHSDKPVLVARVGAEFLAPQALSHYRKHRIPVFPMPDRAVKALKAMTDYARFRSRQPGH